MVILVDLLTESIKIELEISLKKIFYSSLNSFNLKHFHSFTNKILFERLV